MILGGEQTTVLAREMEMRMRLRYTTSMGRRKPWWGA